MIRDYKDTDFPIMLEIINNAAQKYKGRIPDECWHEPYMSADALKNEIAAGVCFRILEIDNEILGFMGTQNIIDKTLIRHAYVKPETQGKGIGSILIKEILKNAQKPILIGTWKSSDWAISFYNKYGFEVCDEETTQSLFDKYWNIPKDMALASVVLRQI